MSGSPSSSKRPRYHHHDTTVVDRKPVIDRHGEPVYRNGQPLYRNNSMLVDHWRSPEGSYAAPVAQHRPAPTEIFRSPSPAKRRASFRETLSAGSRATTPVIPSAAPVAATTGSPVDPVVDPFAGSGDFTPAASSSSHSRPVGDNSNAAVIDNLIDKAIRASIPPHQPPFHEKYPEIMERILLSLPFKTLLAFRGTNKAFNKKITDSFQRFVVEEAHNGVHWEIQLRTAAGYRVSEYPSSSCLFKQHRHVELPENTSLIRFIRKYGSRHGRGLVEVRGPISVNYLSGPHFLGHIVQYLAKFNIRYVPSERGFTTNVTGKGKIILVNDSVGYHRDITVFDSLTTAIYRFDGSETEHLLRTRLRGVEKVVYDFTQWDRSNAGFNASKTINKSNLRLFNLVDHIVASINAECEVVVAGLDEVDVHWLNPNWGLGPDGRPLHINQYLPHLVSSQCDRYGIDLDPEGFKMVYRGHETLYPLPPGDALEAPQGNPMILVVHKD